MNPSNKLNLTGLRFGRLVCVSQRWNSTSQKGEWVCRCDCGTVKAIATASLRSGRTASCGCAHKEMLSRTKTKHGMSKTKLHSVWRGLFERCYNKSCKSYVNYGARGIKVCERWSDFSLFLFDMGTRPEGTSIDRINNDGDYSPDNCRWANRKQQLANRRPWWTKRKRDKTGKFSLETKTP